MNRFDALQAATAYQLSCEIQAWVNLHPHVQILDIHYIQENQYWCFIHYK